MAPTWQEIITSSPGQYWLVCHEVGSNVELAHEPDKEVEAASTIKFPLLLALLNAAQHKRISLRRRIDLKRSHVGRNGSGLLQAMYFNTPFTLYNLAFLMMAVSDNAAANVILELLGHDTVHKYFKTDLGLTHTRLNATRYDFPSRRDRSSRRPRFATTTPAEMIGLLDRLIAGQILDPYHTRIALRFMRWVQRSTTSRRLPATKVRRFGSKTGWIDDDVMPTAVLNECGYIQTTTGRTYTFAIYSDSPLDPELPYSVDSAARIEFARLSRALFDALEGKA